MKRTGLVPMRWTQGPQKTVIGSIQWAVWEAKDDQVCRLLLFPALLDLPKTAPQEMCLDWHTPAGGNAALPVLLCPFCGQRCRYLYQATKPQKREQHQGRGVKVGEFACRLCVGLCYSGQLTSRSRSGLSACLHSLPNDLLRSRSLSEEAVAEAQEAVLSIVEFQKRCAERLKTIQNEKSLGDTSADQDALKQPHPQEQVSCLPGNETVKPKRSAGRPKERRRYNGKERKAAGCSGRLASNEGYCVGCRARRQLIQAAPFLASNGRVGIKGRCAECGRGLCRMGSNN